MSQPTDRTPDSEGLDQDHRVRPAESQANDDRRAKQQAGREQLLSSLRDGLPGNGSSGEGELQAESGSAALSALEAALAAQQQADQSNEDNSIPGHARAVLYLRVSTKEQATIGGEDEGYSIPAQREACSRKAQALGATVDEVFVDLGESAKTADRPNLQKMLKYIAEHQVQYVIVHKLNRLARDEFDGYAIALSLQKAGVQLVSVMEHFDNSPSGLLLRAIMNAVGAYEIRNLGQEVVKGSTQKARNGGTPFTAPIGYLNVRYPNPHGKKDIRSVEVDPERAPLVVWCFEQYATGEWTTKTLLAEATRRGLRSKPTPKRPAKPLGQGAFGSMLKNPYYMGIVSYRGVHYEGKHAQLVSPELWLRVQDILASHDKSGEKTRKHPHYLKGSIFCARCESRLVFSRNKGNGGSYDYFFCQGRQRYGKHDCTFPWVSVDKIEAAVEAFYSRFQFTPVRIEGIKAVVKAELAEDIATSQDQAKRQQRIIARLEGEREKLLQAHYGDAIPLNLLKKEQNRITREIAEAESQLSFFESRYEDVQALLTRALALAGSCHAQYQAAPNHIRRQFNQGFFKAIYINEHGEVERVELTEPFAQLLAEDMNDLISHIEAAQAKRTERQQVAREQEIAQLNQAWGDEADLAQLRDMIDNPQNAERPDPGDGSGLLVGVGSKKTVVVPPTGFEPVPPP